MDQKDRYAAMAEEADELAAKAKDGQLRDAWKRIAASYRDLAALKAGLREASRNWRP